jgi:6-phosphofructo-2-kinase
MASLFVTSIEQLLTLKFLTGSVGILDATNSTIARRQILFDRIKKREPKLGILFIESVCEDEKVSCWNAIVSSY